jgi:WD40 repeat protein
MRARWCAFSFPLIAGVRQRSRSPAFSHANTSSTLQIFGELWKGPQLVPVRTPPIRWHFRAGRLQARGAQTHCVGPQVHREIRLLVIRFNDVFIRSTYCSWSPDSEHVLTASRDGTCKLWRINGTAAGTATAAFVCLHTFTPFAGVAVTAVDILRYPYAGETSDAGSAGGWLVALGAESGDLQVRRFASGGANAEADSFPVASTVPDSHCHGATVRRIRWRPVNPEGQVQELEFASCGEDRTVRVHRLRI